MILILLLFLLLTLLASFILFGAGEDIPDDEIPGAQPTTTIVPPLPALTRPCGGPPIPHCPNGWTGTNFTVVRVEGEANR